jgi:hypothetical protein
METNTLEARPFFFASAIDMMFLATLELDIASISLRLHIKVPQIGGLRRWLTNSSRAMP